MRGGGGEDGAGMWWGEGPGLGGGVGGGIGIGIGEGEGVRGLGVVVVEGALDGCAVVC